MFRSLASTAMQKAYDEETAHGLLRDEQERWDSEITREMEALKAFARQIHL
jgi:hypothetical protein